MHVNAALFTGGQTCSTPATKAKRNKCMTPSSDAERSRRTARPLCSVLMPTTS